MQETTFPVEIFIHDDASTDGTAEIVKEYAEKYPKLFWTVLQTENQWSKGRHNAYFFELMQKQRGEFIALCEGDDYWISKEKLQKQLDVLEKDNRFSGCCHDVKSNFEGGEDILLFNKYCGLDATQAIELKDILNSNLVATCSSLLRMKHIHSLPHIFSDLAMGDWPLCIWSAMHGDFFYDSKPMGFYRRHAGGVWSSMQSQRQNLETVKMFSRISKILKPEYEIYGVNGLLKYYAPIVLNSFLSGSMEYYLPAHSYVYSTDWSPNSIRTKLAVAIIDSGVIGFQGTSCKRIRDNFLLCTEINKSFKALKVPRSKGCDMLAKSIVSQAWVNKIIRPFFALENIILSVMISLKGTISTLFAMCKKSASNLLFSSHA